MVKSTPTPSASSHAAIAPPPTPIHKPFSWLAASLAASAHAEFVVLTRNICAGAAVVAQLGHRNNLNVETEQAPMLSADDMERLAMMSTSALQMLVERADLAIESMNDQALNGGAA